MPITTYMPYEPTTGQWLAIQKLSVFLENNINQVYMLQGYAGTGKTTLQIKAMSVIGQQIDFDLILQNRNTLFF